MTMSKTRITDQNIFKEGLLDSMGRVKVGKFTMLVVYFRKKLRRSRQKSIVF